MFALSKTTYNLQNTVDTQMKEHLITLDRVGYISTRTLQFSEASTEYNSLLYHQQLTQFFFFFF